MFLGGGGGVTPARPAERRLGKGQSALDTLPSSGRSGTFLPSAPRLWQAEPRSGGGEHVVLRASRAVPSTTRAPSYQESVCLPRRAAPQGRKPLPWPLRTSHLLCATDAPPRLPSHSESKPRCSSDGASTPRAAGAAATRTLLPDSTRALLDRPLSPASGPPHLLFPRLTPFPHTAGDQHTSAPRPPRDPVALSRDPLLMLCLAPPSR